MDWFEIAGWVLAVVLAAGAFVWKFYHPDDGKAEDYWRKLESIGYSANKAVEAAQQLWDSGQIPETPDGKKDPRFYVALSYLQSVYPTADEAALEMAIESAVFWLKRWTPPKFIEEAKTKE